MTPEALAAHAAARFETRPDDEDDRRALQAALDAAPPRAVRAALGFELARRIARRRDFSAAMALLRRAEADLRGRPASALAARVAGLTGTLCAVQGDLPAALRCIARALARYRAARAEGALRERARLLMNRSIALTDLGRPRAARVAMATALALFEQDLAAGRRDALPELARARRNLGYLLGREGDFAASAAVLSAAAADFARVLAGRPADRLQWQASRAGTLNSLGYSLFACGRLDEARATLDRAARALRAVVRLLPVQRDEQARTWVNQGHVALAAGDAAAARRHYGRAWRQLQALVAGGAAPLRADAANAALGLAQAERALGHRGRAARRAADAMAALATLTHEGRLQHVSAWCEALRRWRSEPRVLQRALAAPPHAPMAAGDLALRLLQPFAREPGLAPAELGLLLDWQARQLVESEPTWLHARRARLAALVAAWRDAALRTGDATAVADWFLATRGLRAWRARGAAAPDPALQALHRLELEILAGAPASAATERRIAQWRAQRTALAGRLPAPRRLDARQARAALRPGETLVLLARDRRDALLRITLRRGGVRCDRVPLDAASFDPATLLHLARAALVAQGAGQPLRRAAATVEPGDADTDRFALDVFGRWGRAVFAGLPRRGLVLVPSDDLHLLPWCHLAAEAGVALCVFPSAAAWLQARDADSAPPRWALAADRHAGLPWVEAECDGATAIWGPPAEPADALLAVGHGGVPGGHPLQAGLQLGSDWLRAADLARWPALRRVLLSACVLGHTDDAQGEPLGLLSACFDHGAVFAAGWLTEVPDRAACLYSLALQWSVAQAPGRPWGEVAAALRVTLMQGRWPPGFGAWLAARPALAADAARPPPVLQRVLPWAVALG